ncbi:hypothetical protein [Pseudonocardia abyssalis]|uniref:Iron-containing redox enzyme family protein n=2 Tax=Pseudonocardia abyssalis TaxID=2792008 RepID=A0ABS6UU57_9PSEU|nr:hypothetical protein [Pseudonocardia abyssalis]MBW0135299.1 hypothetical protein [Pseudonocardia abyssalis]
MRQVLAAIADRRAGIDAHPLYRWMGGDDAPLEERFVFAPLFANFILGFRDMNRWFMRYPQPRDAYEEAINRHTEEDETHSALFLEDWAELGLDEHLGWGVEDTVAWYYAAPETEVFRRYAMRIQQMCVETTDPLVRYGFMEAIETCGHVFFGHTAPLAAELAARTGAALRYFGPYHLDRETGGLIDAEDLFETAVLTDRQRVESLRLVHEVFDMFTDKNDHLLAYAERVTTSRTVPSPAADLRRRATTVAAVLPPPPDAPPSPAHRPVAERLAERMDGLRGHPFPAWISGGGGSAADRLAAFLPLWIPDIMGYADLMTYALTYPDPATPPERALNRRVRLLASHHGLFAHDAAALDLDGRLALTAGETLRLLGYAPRTDLQRRSTAAFVTAAYRHRSPVVRYWLVEALQGSGEAFFHHGGLLAGELEARDGVRLDYLADRHRLAHPRLPPDPEADAVVFTRLPLTPGERDSAIRVVDTVFDRLQEQFDQSLRLVGAT